MGAVNFSLDMRLVECLRQSLPLTMFVETGTFKGDTVAAVLPYFKKIMTVEISKPLWQEVKDRFVDEAKVNVYLGSSPDILSEIMPKTQHDNTLFWLDAHWCVAEGAAGEQSQCPLLDEIHAIGALQSSSVILIDDARLFLAAPPEPHEISQWPSFNEIVTALRQLNPDHELMVVNDVIVFSPAQAKQALISYARKCGINWLRASQTLSENEALRTDLEEKEVLIRKLSDTTSLQEQLEEKEALIRKLSDAQSLQEQLEEKEALIRKLSDSTSLKGQLEAKEKVIQKLLKQRSYSPVHYVKELFRPLFHQINIILRPRLGNLCQHAPRKLVLPPGQTGPVALSQTPKISLVTPSYKQAAFIERTLESVLGQHYPNLEYFVQDGRSGDGTKEILERYAGGLTGWESTKDDGQSHAINLGFAKTTGEIMGWINSDDILLPGTLAYVAEYFNHHPKVDVVYGHRFLIDEDDRLIGRWMLPAHNDAVLSWADYIPQETLFWRRRIWDKAGGRIDESFRFAMDWDLITRFRDAGATFARLPRFLGGFRIHAQQKTSVDISETGFKEMDRIRQRSLGRIPSEIEIKKAVLTYMLHHVMTDLWWRIGNKWRMPA